jgi:hypothetical protein
VPFTFALPAEFTKAPIDLADSRGDVVAAAGLSKVDLIAVRRVGSRKPPTGPVTHVVQGRKVTSEVHPVDDTGFAIECQYTQERAKDVREACAEAVDSVERS